MTKKVRAIFDGKVFFPEEPVELEVNGHYILKIEPLKKERSIDDNDAKEDAAFDFSSLAVKTGISDLSTEHDHYLYGVPKRGSND